MFAAPASPYYSSPIPTYWPSGSFPDLRALTSATLHSVSQPPVQITKLSRFSPGSIFSSSCPLGEGHLYLCFSHHCAFSLITCTISDFLFVSLNQLWFPQLDHKNYIWFIFAQHLAVCLVLGGCTIDACWIHLTECLCKVFIINKTRMSSWEML